MIQYMNCFNILIKKPAEERQIRQLQYIAWPDHGVPDENSDFLSFVLRVRQNRTGMVEPTIVHCRLATRRDCLLHGEDLCLLHGGDSVNQFIPNRHL